MAGQEGFGNAMVEASSLGDPASTLTLDLWPKTGSAPASLRRSLPAGGVTRFDLTQYREAEGGYYAARLSAGSLFGGGATLRWPSGAAVGYEASAAGTALILPLIARTVYSHTSYVFAQNAAPNPNGVTLTLFDAEEGSILVEATGPLDADGNDGLLDLGEPETPKAARRSR